MVSHLTHLLLAAVALCPSIALAQTVSLFDGQSKEWDIDSDDWGDIVDGTSDAYDSYPRLCVTTNTTLGTTTGCSQSTEVYDAGGASSSMALAGREVQTAAVVLSGSGITASRRIYVPATGTGYARYLEVLTNNTAAAVTFKVRIGTPNSTFGDLGDFAGSVSSTSAGGTTLTAGLSWFVMNVGSHYLPHAIGNVGVGAVVHSVFSQGTDSLFFEFTPITLAPGETALYMHFHSQQDSAAMGSTVATTIDGNPDLFGIPAGEVGLIRNWITTPQPDGASCFVDSQCTNGNCVDSVCCNTACGGGVLTDCEACSVAAGAATDGVCGVADSATVCRPAASLCDFPETCDGSSIVCPTDVVNAAGTVCRPAAGLCDIAEACDGATGACPADVVVAAGTECRANAGPCDVPEVCDGTNNTCPFDDFATGAVECRASRGACDLAERCNGLSGVCPLDVVLAAGVSCRDAVGACDAAEVCDGVGFACPADVGAADGTDCGDGMVCNGDEVCTGGTCAAPGALDCDDGDVCTADMCSEPDGCSHVDVMDCCRSDTECDDGDPCTDDRCTTTGDCANDPIPGCGDLPDAAGTDAGTTGDAATRPDSGITPPPPPRDDGCGCTAPGEEGGAKPLLALGVLALLGALVVRRRRR